MPDHLQVSDRARAAARVNQPSAAQLLTPKVCDKAPCTQEHGISPISLAPYLVASACLVTSACDRLPRDSTLSCPVVRSAGPPAGLSLPQTLKPTPAGLSNPAASDHRHSSGRKPSQRSSAPQGAAHASAVSYPLSRGRLKAWRRGTPHAAGTRPDACSPARPQWS